MNVQREPAAQDALLDAANGDDVGEAESDDESAAAAEEERRRLAVWASDSNSDSGVGSGGSSGEED